MMGNIQRKPGISIISEDSINNTNINIVLFDSGTIEIRMLIR